MLEDAEGSPITITKTDTDVITLYAQVFLQISAQDYGSNFMIPKGEENHLLSFVHCNVTGFEGKPYYRVSFGDSKEVPAEYEPGDAYPTLGNRLATVTEPTTTEDLEALTISVSMRLEPEEGNGKIWEIAANGMISSNTNYSEFDPSNYYGAIFRAVMPIAGVYEGHTIEDEALGDGDGSQTTFTTTWDEINSAAVVVKVDGSTKTEGVDFTIDREAGEVEFSSAPANGDPVTITYHVDYIPKDTDHVLDVSWELAITDANA